MSKLLACLVFSWLLAAAPAAAQELVPGPLSSPGDELNASFTPDGQTVYFTRKLDKTSAVIMVSHRHGAAWTTPTVAPFSGKYPDYDPFVAPDGRRLFWISKRPVDGGPRDDLDIWMVEQEGNGWGLPMHLEAPVNSDAGEFYPTVARNGTLYFSSNRPGGQGRGDIYRAPLVDGRYGPVESLGDSVNSAAFDGDPFIAADERYLIFTGWGRAGGDAEGDLYYAEHRNGVWGTPRRLRDGINTSSQEYAPIVSPDGEWLYWTSYRRNNQGDVYRIPLADAFSP
jgi:hypothetical protein